MSYAYSAATLDAMIDANDWNHSSEIFNYLLENYEHSIENLERSLLDTKALILDSIYRYYKAYSNKISVDQKDKLKNAMEQFVVDLRKCPNEQEQIEGLKGTLFWREAKGLGWGNLATQLESQAYTIQRAFSNDMIWDTEDGSWGYNSPRTGYLTHSWLSFWDYVWSCEDT